jgi:DNA polymerase-4
MTEQHDLGGADGFCRDCLVAVQSELHRCPSCHGPRVLRHPELHNLAIAHLDCDAFYAAVEKRDDPKLKDVPVIVGGGRRGVVATACYVARISGVRSAMPMFEALKLCPDAVVIPPDMRKYSRVGRDVRKLMLAVTPLVEPLSIDEAFLDLSGTSRLHHASPAISLAHLANRIEREIGITDSIGLSCNKYLAKVASDLDKPRGFSLISRKEAPGFLASRPVALIWGVGKALQASLASSGITTIGQLQLMEEKQLIHRYGAIGSRLFHLSRGEDDRRVSVEDDAKSIGAETTFDRDIHRVNELERILWNLAGKVSDRAKRAGLAGSTVVLKLKTSRFNLRTRNRMLSDPTQLAGRIFEAARGLLSKEADGTRFRLIGVSLSDLMTGGRDAELSDLDVSLGRKARAERAMDLIRDKYGRAAIDKGLGLPAGEEDLEPNG